MSDLKKRSKDGLDSTNNGIKELIDKGYVSRVQVKVKGKFSGYDYTVTELPFLGNPFTENPTLLSTKELSTKELRTKKDNTLVQSPLEDSFNVFWNLYDKKSGRKKCLAKWIKMNKIDREDIIDFVPKYVKLKPNRVFRQNPLTFLNSETWNDELYQGDVELGQNGKPFEKPKTKCIVGFERGKAIYEK